MPERQPRYAGGLLVRFDQPLIGVVVSEQGQEVTRYFADEEAASAASRQTSIQAALDLAGAWKDLDWEQGLAELGRIRQESHPTAPLEEI